MGAGGFVSDFLQPTKHSVNTASPKGLATRKGLRIEWQSDFIDLPSARTCRGNPPEGRNVRLTGDCGQLHLPKSNSRKPDPVIRRCAANNRRKLFHRSPLASCGANPALRLRGPQSQPALAQVAPARASAGCTGRRKGRWRMRARVNRRHWLNLRK